MSAPDRPTRAGGPWTRHGHDIPGVTVAGGGHPPAVARCGGPALCRQCREDVAQAHGETSVTPDRSTQTQLNATLRVAEDGRGDAHDARLLAVEVRALRAELDGLRIGLDVETRRADDWQRVADGLAEDAARAAGVARTPQPTVAPGWCCTVGAQAYPGPCPGHGEQEPVRAPLPAVPDGPQGSIAERARSMGVQPRPQIDALMDAGVGMPVGARLDDPAPAVPDGEARDRLLRHYLGKAAARLDLPDQARRVTPTADVDEIESVGEAVLAELERLRGGPSQPDARDVVPRLYAAAAALSDAEPMSCAGGDLFGIAVALGYMPVEVRAAVAAALARPTERER